MPYLWTTEEKVDWESRFCPQALDILVEHEDSCGITWQEMVKLLHVRAKLKVLITYTGDLKGNEKSRKESVYHIKGTELMFQEMIQQAWEALPEDPSSEYLLLIGQLDVSEADARINWYRTAFTYGEGKVRVDHEGPIIQTTGQ